MEYLQNNQNINEGKSLKVFVCAKKAAEITHSIALAQIKVKKIEAIIMTNNKEEMWNILQKELAIYTRVINSTTAITGIQVHCIDKEFYEKITPQELSNQLHTLQGFIYLAEGAKIAGKQVFTVCLKSLLKETKLFTESELALL
ncbi:MAG: hypothetical protein RR659_05300 [Bacilli bacterium]